VFQLNPMADQTPRTDSSSGSEARVAFDLMVFIGEREEIEGDEKPQYTKGLSRTKKSREYWLSLYLQCRKAVRGTSTLDQVLAAGN